MPACTYCTNEADGREHWIPRGLGTFRGWTPFRGICQDCNIRLGFLDEELLRTGLVGLHRAMLGIEGRHGPPKQSPFLYKAMQSDPPITLMVPALGRQHQLYAETRRDESGRTMAEPIRQVVLEMPDGQMQSVPFSRGWNAEHLRIAIKNRGLEGGKPREIFLDSDEDAVSQEAPQMLSVRTLLTEVFGDFRAMSYGGQGEITFHTLPVVAAITATYLRALVKVAFHYTLWACPVLRGDDPVYADVRNFVSTGEGSHSRFVQLVAPEFIPDIQGGRLPRRISHFLFAAITPQHAVCHLQFFVGPHGAPPPSLVTLALKPLLVEAKYLACHHAAYCDEATNCDGHDGELFTLDVFERRLVAPSASGWPKSKK